MKKLSIETLMSLEKKYKLWSLKLFDYPLWIHCREPLVSTAIMASRQIKKPTMMNMWKSMVDTLFFLGTQNKYEKVFFLMERPELLEIYKQDKSQKKILFLNPEQNKQYTGKDCISSDFFSFLRFVSRKIAFRIFRKKYQETIYHIEKMNLNIELNEYIKIAMGDALFLQFLSLILSKKSDKIYSGAVIPIGEKFLNTLNSYEVQHGVIHPLHIGYIGLPKVKNRLILYSKRYQEILLFHGYKGEILIQEYKKTFFERTTKRYFPIVIYTQPMQKMQESISHFFKVVQPSNVFIQRHPKDYFDYGLEGSRFVTATTPFEVGYPILYVSSIIENFTLYNKTCYIYDLHYSTINLEEFLKIYTKGSKSKMIIMQDLKSIYQTIMEQKVCQK